VSLLNRGTETVTVYPEEVRIDSDGNKFTGPAKTGTTHRAVVQPISSTQSADFGSDTKSRYRLRLINYPHILDAQSQIEWSGKRYSLEGDGKIYNGSRRTAHVVYTVVRG